MTKLKTALRVLELIYGRYPDSKSGGLRVMDIQNINPEIGDIRLRGSLLEYFSILDTSDAPVVGNFLSIGLCSFSGLMNAQDGWRWIFEKGKHVRNKSWHDDWVIFADRNGDAIFCDQGTGEVFGSIQQRNYCVANSLAEFFRLVYIFQWVESTCFDGDCRDDDFNIKDGFFLALRGRLNRYGDDYGRGFLDFCFM